MSTNYLLNFADAGKVKITNSFGLKLDELLKDGFVVKGDTIWWLNATTGKALECKERAYKYWKDRLCYICEKIAKSGNYEYATHCNMYIEGAKYFEQDGFRAILSGGFITSLDWRFATFGKANELRLLARRKGIDDFLPLVRQELEKAKTCKIEMDITPVQISVLLEIEQIRATKDGGMVLFEKILTN